MDRKEEMINSLKKQLSLQRQLVGVASGSGLTAKYAIKGGADFILALSSGRYRQMGVSSLAAFLPFSNNNDFVMDFASKELLPLMQDKPLLFGIAATDPTIHLEQYIRLIKEKGFAGINNYPTVGLIDGAFRIALEENGFTYEKEVEAIKIASEMDLLTVAFVFNEQEAIQMLQAGADIICIHLGLTTGGMLGAKRLHSLQTAKRTVIAIDNVCKEYNSEVLKMIYGGPVNNPIDLQFIYDGTDIHGYIGGSAFERIPAERILLQVTQSFKETSNVKFNQSMQQTIEGLKFQYDYISYVKQYIAENYPIDITLNEMAKTLNLSRSYLSTLFKKEVGVTFSEYLIDFRLNRAGEMMREVEMPLATIAEMVGYTNYAQFSKMFKKRFGVSPTQYKNKHKHKMTEQ